MTNQNPQREEHGFQKIGASLPPISHLRPTRDTLKAKSKALVKASAPTTKPKVTRLNTVTLPGGSGSCMTLTFTAPQELAELTTGALMKALEASLPPQLKLQPVWRDGETEWECPLTYMVEGIAANRDIAKGVIRRTMTPLPVKEIAKELTTLNALTKRRKEDHGDTKLLVAAYVEKLAPYPGEAVIHVLRKWPETQDGKWWPSWSELYEMLEYRVGERRLMLEAL